MTSQRKIAANRSNSQRSSGPRTADGKRKASGNSRKHGWAALERRLPTASPAIEQVAKALSGDAQDPALLAQARIIAENDLMGTAIRLEKIRTIEMLVAEAKMSDDEFFQRRLDRLLAAIFAKFKEYLPSLASLRQCYSSEEIAERVEEYFDGEDLLALRKFVKRFMDKQPPKPRVRDEYQAMELAAADLDRLERYETRAWSRQMRAMRTFCRTQPNG
jgi:hypothetical protein